MTTKWSRKKIIAWWPSVFVWDPFQAPPFLQQLLLCCRQDPFCSDFVWSSTTRHNPYQNKWAVKIWVPEKSRNMKSSGIPRDLGYPNPSSHKRPCFIPIPGKTISSTMICRGMAHSMALSPATGLWDLWCQWSVSRCTHWKICSPYARVCLSWSLRFFCLLADSRKWKRLGH